MDEMLYLQVVTSPQPDAPSPVDLESLESSQSPSLTEREVSPTDDKCLTSDTMADSET